MPASERSATLAAVGTSFISLSLSSLDYYEARLNNKSEDMATKTSFSSLFLS
jgi:hypothetical protein